MPNFYIDFANINDLAVLSQLLQELFTLEKDFTVDSAKQLAGLQQLLVDSQRACICVARHEEKVVGLCTAQLVISTSQGSYSAWIEDVIVSQQYRGQGIGKALLNHALNWAKQQGATRAQLVLDSQNTAAIQFYQQVGWRETQLWVRQYFM